MSLFNGNFTGVLIFFALSCLTTPCGAADVAGAETADVKQNSAESPEQKIINGEKALSGAWPWMVSLVNGPDNYQNTFCGGVLIDAGWVLTTAHCVMDPPFEILTGVTSLLKKGRRIGVKRIYVHPEYFNSKHEKTPDIALIELESDVSLEPIDLYEGNESLEGETATVIGWGALASNGTQYPLDLMQANIPIVSNGECNAAYDGIITGYELCAGYPQGGTDTCSGDSGGPIMILEGNTWKLVGVTAWGNGCAQPGQYGVYTRISALRDWIDWSRKQYSQVDVDNANCAFFDTRSGIVHIPCLDLDMKYWFDLELRDNHLEIMDFGDFFPVK